MKITRDNYEPWFLDYLEGNLEDGMVDEFIEFIRQHPDLREELLLWEPMAPDNEELPFPGKERLYKEELDHPQAFDPVGVAWLEGDLDLEQAANLGSYLERHPGKKGELELFSLTRLTPDFSVVYPLKDRLYHQTGVRRLIPWVMRIAAMLLLALGTYAVFFQPDLKLAPGETVTEITSPSRETTPVITQGSPEETKTGEILTPGNESLSSTRETGQDEGNGSMPAGKEESAASKVSVRGNRSAREALVAMISADKPSANAPEVTGRAIDPEETGSVIASTEAGYSGTQSKGSSAAGIPAADPASVSESVHPAALQSPDVFPAMLPPRNGVVDTSPEVVILVVTSPAPLQETVEHAKTMTPGEWIMDKTGLPGITSRKLLRSGLKLAMSLSKEKFNYKTNQEGEITAWNLDTRLIGLSIPVNKQN